MKKSISSNCKVCGKDCPSENQVGKEVVEGQELE